jgi:hypothetical protein
MADDFDWNKYQATNGAAGAPAASNGFDWSQYQASPAASAPLTITPPAKPVTPPVAATAQAPAAKPQLEFADAPTIANMPTPGALDSDFKNSSWGDVLAAKFGPYFTDDPLARQNILAKRLPGATAVNDKFGNPMVEYKGTRYYTSRPGEFDATDLASGVTKTAAAVPVAAAAIPLAELAGGGTLAYMGANALTGGATSIGEDVLANKAGGGNQVDLKKAGIDAAASAVIPLALQKIVTPAAGYVAEKFANATGRNLLIDPTLGTVTKEGQQLFAKAGLDPSQFTADQLGQIQSKVLRSFGSPDVARQTANQTIGQEFGVPLTTGQMTGDVAQRAAEDQMRQGGKGTIAQGIVKNADTEQTTALNQAQQTLRSRITGAAQPMDQNQIGDVLGGAYRTERGNTKAAVNALYGLSSDPAALAAAGVPNEIPMSQVSGIGQRVRAGLSGGNSPVIVDSTLTPAAAKALQIVDNFSNGVIPNLAEPTAAAGGTKVGVNWSGVDQTRKTLNAYYGMTQPGSPDRRAVGQIIANFDNELGANNPLLDTARQGYSQYADLFKAQKGNAVGTNSVMNKIGNDANAGPTIYNSVFGTQFKKGEAQQVVGNLQTMFANNPDGMTALKEGGLQRLFVDAQGQPLGENAVAKNIKQALSGPQAELYKSLYAPEELAALHRYGTLAENVGSAKQAINGSKTSYPIMNMLRSLAPKGIGAGVGAGVGQFFGHPEAGAVAGGYVGNAVGAGLNALAANRAVAGALPSRRIPYVPMILGTSAIPGLLGQ